MSSKTAINELPDFLAHKISGSDLLKQPIDQFRYPYSPVGKAFRVVTLRNPSVERSLNGNAISGFYHAGIHFPYQIASLEVKKKKERGDDYHRRALLLPNEDYVYLDSVAPLIKAMRNEHVNPGEWSAFQDILLLASPEEFSPERLWMAEHFPQDNGDMHAAFLKSAAGHAALDRFSGDYARFSQEHQGETQPHRAPKEQ